VARYLADTSAWHRSLHVEDRWRAWIEADEIALCAPVALELLWSARSRAEYRSLEQELSLGFRHLRIDSRAEDAARRAQAALATSSRHRGPTPVDLLVAAIAQVNDSVLLHYDRHFDTIQRVTGQPMEWLAARGSID
jgi:hypothetical protein